MSRRGIICGGSIVVDVNKVIDRLPPPEELAIILSSLSPSAGIRPLARCLAYGEHHGFGTA